MAVSKKNARQRFLNAATACALTGAICLIFFVIQALLVQGHFDLGLRLKLTWFILITPIGWMWGWPAIIYIGLRWVVRTGYPWAVITALSVVSLHAAGMLLLMILSLVNHPELFTLLIGLCTLALLGMTIVFLARCIPALRSAHGGPRGFAVVPMGAPLGNSIPPGRDSYPLPPAALSGRVAPHPPVPLANQEMIDLD